LEPLKNLNQLKELTISDTDIESGLEYLPESVETLTCSAMPDEPNFQVSKIFEKLSLCDNNIKI